MAKRLWFESYHQLSIVFLNLLEQMEFSLKFYTVKSGLSIIQIEHLQVDFVLANSADPDGMLLYTAFHLSLLCLPKYPFWGSRFQRVKQGKQASLYITGST